jgi:hypothetical protein
MCGCNKPVIVQGQAPQAPTPVPAPTTSEPKREPVSSNR